MADEWNALWTSKVNIALVKEAPTTPVEEWNSLWTSVLNITPTPSSEPAPSPTPTPADNWSSLWTSKVNITVAKEDVPAPTPEEIEGWSNINETKLTVSLPTNWLLYGYIIGGVGVAAALYITLKE